MTKGLHRIHLREFDQERYADDWVDIKARRSFADGMRIDGALAAVSSDTTKLLEYTLTLFATSIRAWTLKDEAGEPIPTDRSGFLNDDFEDDVGDWLADQIRKYHESRKRGSEDRKNSGSPSVAT